MIDLHCHLLPGIDDGPQTMEDALDEARGHVAGGVGTVVATPHVSWDYPTRSPLVRSRVAELTAELGAARIPLEVVPGGEIAVTLAMDLSEEELGALALGDGPYLLVEAPLSPSAVGFERLVQHVQTRGHRVLLAHPERCPIIHQKPEILEALVRGGVLTQLTASSFAGVFGRTVQRLSHELARQGLVHVVASDAHDAVRRPPGLREPLEAAGLGDFVEHWCQDVPRAILDGDPIPPPPGPPPDVAPRKRRRFGRL